jgi:hypothetical protein
MTTKHTPGPWKLDGGKGRRGERYVWSDRSEKGLIGTHEICVAVIQPKARCEGGAAFAEEEIEANANLVVSAPDLLEALELVRDEFATGNRWTAVRIQRVVEVVRAAIAKAEGR